MTPTSTSTVYTLLKVHSRYPHPPTHPPTNMHYHLDFHLGPKI